MQVSAAVGARVKALLHAYPNPAALTLLVGTNDISATASAKVRPKHHVSTASTVRKINANMGTVGCTCVCVFSYMAERHVVDPGTMNKDLVARPARQNDIYNQAYSSISGRATSHRLGSICVIFEAPGILR